MFFVFAVTLAAFVHGQNLSIPQDWRKPNSSRLRPERLAIAQAAIDSLTPVINTTDGSTAPAMDFWTYAQVPAALAQHDYISGTQDHHALVSNIITGFRNTHDPSYFNSSLRLVDITSNILPWGLAAIYGYRAYNDTDLLNTAIVVWDVVTPYSVSQSEGANGTQHMRSVSFPVNCVSNVTSAGAVFWIPQDPTSLTSNGETVGAYVALSSHLWEQSGLTKYLDAARLSAGFISSHMYSQSDNIVLDNYNIGSCNGSGPSLAVTYNQGFFIEGLAILSAAPDPDNSTWSNLLQTLVGSTVMSSQWTESGDNAGVITEKSSKLSDPTVFGEPWVFRIALIRGLYEVWLRADSSSAMANLVQAFTMVQYNALLDLASHNGDFYSPVWTGPALQTRVPWGQLSALEVLNAAINMSSTSTGTSSSTGTSAPPTAAPKPSTPSALAGSSKRLTVGAIAGIVIGASVVVFVVIAGCVVWRIRRRRRGESRQDGDVSISDEVGVDPFPPGLPVSQQGVDGLPAKGHIHGLTVFVPSNPESTAIEDVVSVPSADGSPNLELPMPEGIQETTLRRFIQQVVNSMNQHEPPPSYYTGSE
ncbi:hypothetical protein PENSPDRAFT_493617 [Peniophora sp. CONT]|nr:hypothetical protein PENSPDRAFT_493617 [Peniophora sp. CONT]